MQLASFFPAHNLLLVFVRRACICMLSLAGAAHAGVIYQFDSSNYGTSDGAYTTSMHLTIQITLDNPLPTSALSSDVDLLPGFSMSWFDGVGMGSSSDAGFTVQTIDLSTDAGGNVVAWDFSFWNSVRFTAGNNQPSGFLQVGQFDRSGGAFSDSGAGSWSITQVNDVPEPNTLLLAGLGLCAALASRRAKQSL